MTWTDEKCDRLRVLWDAGYSASQIAADLGELTRNAVIGKAHRLGLADRNERRNARHIPRRKSEKQPQLNRGKVLALMTPPTPEPPAFDGQPITLMELNDATCRWPVNEDVRHMLYCGKTEASISAGCPYCREHSLIAFSNSTPRI